ncbi:activator-dependent family glycosyltransferase [Nonomuraea sp. NPDC003804]|uniref:activator-dependent family glycosyltransferase n=1 Tax=Nonomuraea sp. NPDC003804 TaxID=3154547 RepID=UPI0033AFE8A4
MRVLMTYYSERTHLFCMVPLAQALIAAGHEVRVASQPSQAEFIMDTGLPAVAVGKDHVVWRLVQAREDVFANLRTMGCPPFDRTDEPVENITWDDLAEGYSSIVPWWWRLVNDPMIPDLVEFCRFWQPDLVIWEPGTYAGAVAARVTGVAGVRALWGADMFGYMRQLFVRLRDAQPEGSRTDPLADWLGRWARKYGATFDEEMTCGRVTLDQLPESVRLPTGLPIRSMRYAPYNGRSVVPRWLWEPAERRRVCLTLGTSSSERMGGYSAPVADILGSLAELDVEVVATVPERERAGLGTLPPNVRLVEFAPLHALAATCEVVIHHGGWGSASTSGINGVPQLVLAQQFDAPPLARRLAARGGALQMHESQATGANVREHVVRLLEEPAFAREAAGLRDEMLAMPSPSEIVPELERLAAERRS